MAYKVELLPAQKRFLEVDHNCSTDISVYQGGYGSGKTFSGSLLGIILCLKYPKIRGLVGAQTLGLVRDTTYVQYIEHLDNMGFKLGTDYIEKKAESKIVFENGSEILFRHLEEPEKLKSLNLGFVEIEEMSDVPESTFHMLLSRLRQAKFPNWEDSFKYRLFGHTNPEQKKGWIWHNFVNNTRENYRLILAPTIENYHLPEGFIENMKEQYSEEYYKMNVLGEFGDYTSNLVTKGFNDDLHIKKNLKIDPKYPIHLTCDFNRDPMAWYVCQIINDKIYIIFELVEQHTDTAHSAEIISDVLSNYKANSIILNGDASGNFNKTSGNDFKILMNSLVANGFTSVKYNLMKKNPPIEYRINCWNNNIMNAKGDTRIYIDESCEWLIYNIWNLECEEGGSKPKRISTGKLKSDPKAKYLGHPIDAVSYLVVYYFPIKDNKAWVYTKKKNSESDNKKYRYRKI